MSNSDEYAGNHFSQGQPDAFDRAYGQAQGFPHTRESTVTAANVMGIGGRPPIHRADVQDTRGRGYDLHHHHRS